MARIPPKVRRLVLALDPLCVATLLWPHQCTTRTGEWHSARQTAFLEMDHVREFAMAGQTAPSTPGYLVPLCGLAHQRSGWATRNRPLLRRWLALRAEHPAVPAGRRAALLRSSPG